MAAVRFSLPAQLMEPIPNLGMSFAEDLFCLWYIQSQT